MDVILENAVELFEEYNSQQTVFEILKEFNRIVGLIKSYNSESELRYVFRNYNNKEHFLLGFGGSHMWVKQKVQNQAKKQVIFVKFE